MPEYLLTQEEIYTKPVVDGCLVDTEEYVLDHEVMARWCKSDDLTINFGLNNRCTIHISDKCTKKKMCENF